MKRLYFLLFALLFVFSLCACDDDSSTYGNTPSTGTTTLPAETAAPVMTTAPIETTVPPETAGVTLTEMYWADGPGSIPADDSSDWKDAADSAVFEETQFEPGHVVVRYIKLVNNSSTEKNFTLSLIPSGELSPLWDVIDIYSIDPAVELTDRMGLQDYETVGTFYEFMVVSLGELATGKLPPNSSQIITVAFKMQETAGNECQGLSIGFDIQLVCQ